MKESLLLICSLLIFSPTLIKAQNTGEEVSIEEKINDILDLTKSPKYTPADQLGGKGYILRTIPWGDHDPIYGYKFKSPLETRTILRHENKIVYDKTYHMIGGLKRAVPQRVEGHKEGRITIMGCSFIFGSGLDDDETIMANLACLMPSYEIDNISLIGSGPNITLANLELEQYQAPKIGDNDIYIYVYSEAEHLTRANGFMIPLEWVGTSPFYKKMGDHLERDGTIEEAWPMRSKILTWMRKYISTPLGIDYDFPPIRDVHREYVCDLFEQMDKTIKSRNEKAEFFIYYYPMSPPPDDYYHRCFKERGVATLPFQGIRGHELRYEFDGHPNPSGAKKIAELLKENLEDQVTLKK